LATSSGRVLIKTTTDNGTDALQVAGSVNVTSNAAFGSVSAIGGYRLKVEGLGRFEGANTVLNYGELDANNVYFQALNTAGDAAKGFKFFGTAEVFSIATTGAATFSSSVFATTGLSTNGDVEVGVSGKGLVLSKVNVGPKNAVVTDTNGDLLFNSSSSGFNNLRFTGAATFSSSVTATTYTGSTTTVSTTQTIADGIETVFVTNTGATTITVTLPSASGKTGMKLHVIRTAGQLSSVVNVTSVNGGTHSLICRDAIILVSNGSTWNISSKYNSTDCN
jgi:hypothetical protein